MPFIRQTRDKRGFEHTYVMHTYHPGAGGPSRPRVLYLFCSPSNLRVGRTALDAEVMEALEHMHPDLSFDWSSVSHEPPPRAETPDRHARRPAQRPAPRPEPRPTAAPVVPPAPGVPSDDASLLGRALGAAEAARLRRRHSELVQRIGRRARTPEERDRLFERARRLNPDGWSEESEIRSQASTLDSALDAIGAELPSRRRGRRGGRNREGERPPTHMPSGIMTRDIQETGASHEGSREARVDRAGDSAGNVDAGGPAASGPEAETDPSSSDAEIPRGD